MTGGTGVGVAGEAHVPRVIQRRPGLPGGRAALGGLLMAIAAAGVFAAYAGAGKEPRDALVVASRDIRVGETIEADDVHLVRGVLPAGASARAFSSEQDVVGHVALGPIGSGELVQAGGITAERPGSAGVEVAIALPRDQIAVGRLKQGERVDVYVTYDQRTSSVVRDAEVVMIATREDGSLTSDREISIVISVPSDDVVAALVHALRTGEVTVVRSTFAAPGHREPVVVFEAEG
ncbi:MAG TPA: SAF domain-containing protein [Acidimicrobiales bacterium]|nr:SAF domain-containing protein [Acidimicrobiales bacterium]